MKNRMYTLIAVCLAAFVSGCATTPKLTQEQILAENPEIARLDKELNDARALGADYLAPEGYELAASQFDRAVSEASSGRKDTGITWLWFAHSG